MLDHNGGFELDSTKKLTFSGQSKDTLVLCGAIIKRHYDWKGIFIWRRLYFLCFMQLITKQQRNDKPIYMWLRCMTYVCVKYHVSTQKLKLIGGRPKQLYEPLSNLLIGRCGMWDFPNTPPYMQAQQISWTGLPHELHNYDRNQLSLIPCTNPKT